MRIRIMCAPLWRRGPRAMSSSVGWRLICPWRCEKCWRVVRLFPPASPSDRRVDGHGQVKCVDEGAFGPVTSFLGGMAVLGQDRRPGGADRGGPAGPGSPGAVSRSDSSSAAVVDALADGRLDGLLDGLGHGLVEALT